MKAQQLVIVTKEDAAQIRNLLKGHNIMARVRKGGARSSTRYSLFINLEASKDIIETRSLVEGAGLGFEEVIPNSKIPRMWFEKLA